MIVKTNQGELTAELVKTNKKSVLVKLTNSKEVTNPDGTTRLELSYKTIKRTFSDVVRF